MDSDGTQDKRLTRREYLARTSAVLGGSMLPNHFRLDGENQSDEPKRKIRVAVVYTAFTYRSHMHVLLENFLKPYLFCGKVIEPQMEIVSMCGDQFPEGDMAHQIARENGIPIVPTIREAMTLGRNRLAVDAVLCIGEHGTYPTNELGQVMYPRKRFFDQIVSVMKETGTVVPLYSDKHFSYRYDWAKEMYDTAHEMKIPFMAGSSVPLAQRQPMLNLPHNCNFEEVMLVHGGGPDAYDFHALEVLQSMMEKRKGAETGVSSVQCLLGDAVWKAEEAKLWNPDLVEAALRPELGDKAKEWRQMSPQPYLILVHYKDGFTAPLITVPGNRWAFACRLKGESKPLACNFQVGPWVNRNLFKALSHAIQYMFVTKKTPYPIERTLLTTGLTEAVMQSRHRNGDIQPTPHLEFSYHPRDFTAFRENGASWKILTDEVPEPKGLDTFGSKLLIK